MSDKQQELLFNLKFQEKMLQKQAEKESKNANKERRIAKRHLQKGERNFAQLHATNSVRCEQHSMFLRQNAARVAGMIADLKMAEVQAKTAKMLDATCKEMAKYMENMDLEKIAATAVKYDQIRGKTQEVQQILAPETDLEAGSSVLLDDLQNEILADQESLISQIPVAPQPVQQQQHEGRETATG